MSDQPITRADLDAVRAEITTAQNHIIQAIAQMLSESEQRIQATHHQEIEATETKMLSAFHRFAERHDARWTATRILANDAQTRVDDLRDETTAKLKAIMDRLDKLGGGRTDA